MLHQAQKGFCRILVGIPQHQKVFLVYIEHIRNIISLYDVFLNDSLSSMLAYMFQTYAEDMAMQPDVSYIPFATSSRGQTGNIIMFAHVEEGDLLYETRDDVESSDEYEDDSIIPPLISKE